MPVKEERWILVGPRACGKTTLGHHLAELWKLPFADLDDIVTTQSGQSPDEWIQQEKTVVFRHREAAALRFWLAQEKGILATGGGTPLHPESFGLLKRFSPVVYLQANAPIRIQRLARFPRQALTPLEGREEVALLDRQREPLYLSVADASVASDASLASSLASFAVLRARFFKMIR